MGGGEGERGKFYEQPFRFFTILSLDLNCFCLSGATEDKPPFWNDPPFPFSICCGLSTGSLRVSRDSLGLVELLQILFLLCRQDLARRPDGLVQALEAAEANDGAGDTLVDPSQGDV